MNEPLEPEVVIFNTALQLSPPERAGYLARACGSDAVLRSRVEALLRASEEAGEFLSKPVDVQVPAAPGAPGVSAERPGDVIGRYKLLQQIGEGGCGVVYMAEQEEPVRRRVALKVIKLGMDTKSVIARFEAERQALALMDHPNIARVFDAGATTTGRPYFVMELVRGVKITEYCDQNSLTTQERLNLFVEVCRAVQHAHQKGIIHRDLKPSNILVTVNDGMAVPKVIDFGIAKATQGRLTDATVFTAFEQFIGTPAYMSPEQAVMTSVDIDTRSDIYSLGVLLYELLTGRPPFTQAELLEAGLEEMRRTIREKEPARPSTRLSTLGAADLAVAARKRQVEPPRLIHALRGDLDWIVMKCLEKERARRYDSASGLALDVARHLANEPVLARPYTPAYRAAKFVRRHRWPVTAATLVVAGLAGGLVGTLTQARRAARHSVVAERERARAEEQAGSASAQRDYALRQLSRAEALNDLNAFLLSDAAPAGKSFTVGDLLAQAERLADRPGADTDENRTELLISIGRQYWSTDEDSRAREVLGRAYALAQTLTDPHLRARASCALASAIARSGEFDRAERLIAGALEEIGEDAQNPFARIFCLLCGSQVARERGDSQLGIDRVVSAERLQKAAPVRSALAELKMSMEVAEASRMAGRNREAASAFESAFARLNALGRESTERAGTLLNNWGLAVGNLGRPLEAERLFRRGLAISSVNGNDENVSPMLLNNLARTLYELARYDEAADLAGRALARGRIRTDEIVVNQALINLAGIRRDRGEIEQATELLAEAELRYRRMLPAGHYAFASLESGRSLQALQRGDLKLAREAADRAIGIIESATQGREHLPAFLLRRARVSLAERRFEEALTDANRALILDQQAVEAGALSSRIGRGFLTIARTHMARGNLAEAQAAFRSALEHLRSCLGEDHPETREAARGAVAG